jgi:hypothetical protein
MELGPNGWAGKWATKAFWTGKWSKYSFRYEYEVMLG